MKQAVTAEANLQDVAALIASMRKNSEPLIHCAVFIELTAKDPDSLRALRDEVSAELVRSKLDADRLFLRQREGFLAEPLIHCAVFIELTAKDPDSLRALRDEVSAELVRSKLDADRLFLRQREGFLAVNPAGHNVFATQFERVLPAGSVANLFPFNYSGNTDPKGFYVGRDRYGSNVIVDLDRRAEDKTTLPAGSVANLFPFNYSGNTDPKGFYVGRDRYGSNVIVDLDRRAEDKTTASVLILGNSGQGKSYLLKLLLCNILEAGKSAICLDTEHELVDLCSNLGGCFIDLMSGQYRINPLEPKLWDDGSEGDDPDAPAAFRQLCNILEAGKSAICLDTEHELVDLCSNLGGCFIDLMSGQYRINPLEPKLWDDGSEGDDPDAPAAFRQKPLLSQHISFLKDFFRAYRDFTDQHIDTIELMLGRLYAKWGMDDNTDFQPLSPRDYPVLSDLYDVIEEAYRNYDSEEYPLYSRELLQEVLLGLHSMCRGAESKFFNGHTNIASSRFLVFGVKGLLQASRNVKNALLFNVLSYLSDRLLTQGNAVATLDELYIWLSNLTTIEYIRNTLKRVRKKESYSMPAVLTGASTWTISSWSRRSSSSSDTPSGASACINAATNGICWRFMRLRTRRSSSGAPAGDNHQTEKGGEDR